MWAKRDDFLQIVAESWAHPVTGSPFFVWEEKLRRLKKTLKCWSKALPNPNSAKIQAVHELETHQVAMEDKDVTQNDIQKETSLQMNLHKACREEAEWWRLKSRCKWLKDGDRNSSYFHKLTAIRKNQNNVREIQTSDKIINQFEEIKKEATNYFSDLLTEQPVSSDDQLLSLVPNSITSRDNERLNQVITMEEVKETVDNMEEDRSPGPDGYNVNFITLCWDIVKKDLLKMIRKSQSCNKIGGSTNSAFLALIPKEKDAKTFDRFRPISLCNIGYKIITKLMASRLKHILPAIIPENRGGFIKGWKNMGEYHFSAGSHPF